MILGQCWRRKRKSCRRQSKQRIINEFRRLIVLHTQLAFYPGSRSKQVILDSFNPLLTKQNGWILASVFLYIFMDLDFVFVHKNAKNSPISSHHSLGQYRICTVLSPIKSSCSKITTMYTSQSLFKDLMTHLSVVHHGTSACISVAIKTTSSPCFSAKSVTRVKRHQ